MLILNRSTLFLIIIVLSACNTIISTPGCLVDGCFSSDTQAFSSILDSTQNLSYEVDISQLGESIENSRYKDILIAGLSEKEMVEIPQFSDYIIYFNYSIGGPVTSTSSSSSSTTHLDVFSGDLISVPTTSISTSTSFLRTFDITIIDRSSKNIIYESKTVSYGSTKLFLPIAECIIENALKDFPSEGTFSNLCYL